MSDAYADLFYKGMMDAVAAARKESAVIKEGSETFKKVATKLGKTAQETAPAPKATKVAKDKEDEDDDDEEKKASVDPLLERLRAASAK